MNTPIAVLGLGCEFPGANSPEALWKTALFQRRWFRKIPAARLAPEYFDHRKGAPDKTYLSMAALLEGYEFPHAKFGLGSKDLAVADFTHWLALDCAARALKDSGLGEDLPRTATRVIVGNSLTGESSRAELLRLRWPFFRKVLEESGCAWSEEEWQATEHAFKARFAEIESRTLAGSLSNVIAGRIANYLDVRGGSYCVDAACASSLVAVAQACAQLTSGEIECCIVGGVDVSLDPLELVGFAAAGALATGEMTVFDQDRCGFLPGEGCGFALLMRADHPAVGHRRVRALIRGWSVSSDGRFDLTAPNPEGQRLALEGAYRMAGYSPASVAYFEAHGTGTVVGDEVELKAISRLLAGAKVNEPVAVGSIKANIGHTKAAAGMAGLIKSAMALESGVIPPTTGCRHPMEEVSAPGRLLRVLEEPERWPSGGVRRAGVSAFGFGGVNAHIALEGASPASVHRTTIPVGWRGSSTPVEVVVADGESRPQLRTRLARLLATAQQMAEAELPGMARASATGLGGNAWRAAAIAATPTELESRLASLLQALDADGHSPLPDGCFLQQADASPRIGFLFPGHGSDADPMAGWAGNLFAGELAHVGLTEASGSAGASGFTGSPAGRTQASLIAAGLAGAHILAALGIVPTLCLGHSLGEIAALSAAGAIGPSDAVSLGRDRGRLMEQYAEPDGVMEAIMAGERETQGLINGYAVSIAALNSSRQTVVSGARAAVEALAHDARAAHITTHRINGRFAFHSPLMRRVVAPFHARLREVQFQVAATPVYSTVTGNCLDSDADLASHLAAQISAPVRFHQAFESASAHVDAWVEVGAGKVLSGILPAGVAVALEPESTSWLPLLRVLATAFVQGVEVRFQRLYENRDLPPFDLARTPRFFTNPCERSVAAQPRTLPRRSAPAPGTPRESDPPTNDHPPVSCDGAEDSEEISQAVREAIEEEKGNFRLTRTDVTLGPDLSFDSMGLLRLVANVEARIGHGGARHATTAMTVEEFTEIFRTGRQKLTWSDALVSWVRAFDLQWREAALNTAAPTAARLGKTVWIFTGADPSTSTYLARSLEAIGGRLLATDSAIDAEFLRRLLATLQAAADGDGVVFLESDGLLSGFARTFALEHPHQPVLYVHHPRAHLPDFDTLCDELRLASSFREVRYNEMGRRFLPIFVLVDEETGESAVPLSPGDVVIVSGGAKGITAECILALGRRVPARFALVGQSLAGHKEVALNLRRMAEVGIHHEYWSGDITDPAFVERLVHDVEGRMGTVTAIIHGAGCHRPALISQLTAEEIERHTAVKACGLRNLLTTCVQSSLRLVVAFGSVIARCGYEGSAAYALANESCAQAMSDFQDAHPRVRCLTMDWSVWKGTGMGEKLAALPALKNRGVDPIGVEDGVAAFLLALSHPGMPRRILLTGRLPNSLGISFDAIHDEDLPAEMERVSAVPGVELVVDVPVSVSRHPWLTGHTLGADVILPGVFAVHLMQQAAAVLLPSGAPRFAHDVQWHWRIPIPPKGAVLRIQATRQPGGRVLCRLGPQNHSLKTAAASAAFSECQECAAPPGERPGSSTVPPVPVGEAPAIITALYDQLLFHRDEFQVIEKYSVVSAKLAVFQLLPPGGDLGPLAPEIVMQDALIHGIQVCVPGQLLLPSRAGCIRRSGLSRNCFTVVAREIASSADEYHYDVTAFDRAGGVVEQWTDLCLRTYRAMERIDLLPAVLQAIHVERTATATEEPWPKGAGKTAGEKRCFEYDYTIGFKETNAVGNVYFTNHLEWQGRCREMFLCQHAPEILKKLGREYDLVTKSVHCNYEREIFAFDRILIRMSLDKCDELSARMSFEYFRVNASGDQERFADGTQEFACVDLVERRIRPLPVELVSALTFFANGSLS